MKPLESKNENIEKFMKQLDLNQNILSQKSDIKSPSETNFIQKSFRDFTQKPVEEFNDKENIEFTCNRNDTFNPYKRSHIEKEEKKGILESIDLSIKNFDKTKIEKFKENPNKSSTIEN